MKFLYPPAAIIEAMAAGAILAPGLNLSAG